MVALLKLGNSVRILKTYSCVIPLPIFLIFSVGKVDL